VRLCSIQIHIYITLDYVTLSILSEKYTKVECHPLNSLLFLGQCRFVELLQRLFKGVHNVPVFLQVNNNLIYGSPFYVIIYICMYVYKTVRILYAHSVYRHNV